MPHNSATAKVWLRHCPRDIREYRRKFPKEEYRRAIELAERVVEWAEAIIYSFVSDEPEPLSG